MTFFVSKYKDEVQMVRLTWTPALDVGDTLASVVLGAVGGEVPPVVLLVNTVAEVTRVKLGPDALAGSGDFSLTMTTTGGEILAEVFHVTQRDRI